IRPRRAGSFRRPAGHVVKAEKALEAFTPDEVNGWAGKDLDLQIGPRRLSFTSETFILPFSLPHFHFHAVTAHTTSCDHGACRSVSVITRAGCAPDHPKIKILHPTTGSPPTKQSDHSPFMGSQPRKPAKESYRRFAMSHQENPRTSTARQRR